MTKLFYHKTIQKVKAYSHKGEEKMNNEISVWKRLFFIILTLVLAFVVSYALFTGGVIG